MDGIINTISKPIKFIGKSALNVISAPIQLASGVASAVAKPAYDALQYVSKKAESFDKAIVPNLEPFLKSASTHSMKPLSDAFAQTNKELFPAPGDTSEQANQKALNLVLGFTGAGEESKISQLVKEKAIPKVESLLASKEFGLAKQAISDIAPKIAASKSGQEITALIEEAKKIPFSAAEKLVTAIKGAKPVAKEIGVAQTAERASRATVAEQALQTAGGGERGYASALSKLKGSLTPENPTLGAVRDTLNQTDVDSLFTQIQQHPNFNFYEKLTASNGLSKLLTGEVPPPSELAAMEDVFGSDLVKAIRDKRPLAKKIMEEVSNLVNLPKSLITTLDASAPFRQGIVFIGSHPIRSAQAFPEMFKQMGSEKVFNQWLDDLYRSPAFRQIKDAGLYVADPRKISGGLSGREETFLSNLAERIPIFGRLNKASSRAYSGYLNKVRVDVFNDLARGLKESGIDTPENLKGMAEWVNTATGRGNLGKLARITDTLNSILFSPKYLKSRFDLMNPVFYAKLPAPARKQAMVDMFKFLATGTTVLSVAKMAGADVELNPTSADFGKIKIGNTRWDIWGGLQQWVRFFATMVSGTKKTASGNTQKLNSGKFGGTTRLDVAIQFARSKLSPFLGTLADFAAGTTLGGDKTTVKSEIERNIAPLYLQDIQDAFKDAGVQRAIGVGVPAFFGVGTQTYSPYGNEAQPTANSTVSGLLKGVSPSGKGLLEGVSNQTNSIQGLLKNTTK